MVGLEAAGRMEGGERANERTDERVNGRPTLKYSSQNNVSWLEVTSGLKFERYTS